jgi:hypothetical protein
MKRRFTYVVPMITLTLAITGCATLNTGQLSKDELRNAMSLARDKAILTADLTKTEEEAIRQDEPQYGYYLLSGTYAQYFFQWNLPTGMTVCVAGTGDIITLDEAEVTKAPTKK